MFYFGTWTTNNTNMINVGWDFHHCSIPDPLTVLHRPLEVFWTPKRWLNSPEIVVLISGTMITALTSDSWAHDESVEHLKLWGTFALFIKINK